MHCYPRHDVHSDGSYRLRFKDNSACARTEITYISFRPMSAFSLSVMRKREFRRGPGIDEYAFCVSGAAGVRVELGEGQRFPARPSASSACRTIKATRSAAEARSVMRSIPSPAQTGTMSPRAAAAW